jgi:AraC-like DNA-binding protein
MASEIDAPRSRRDDAHRSISFEALDATLLDALVRLVNLLDEPTLVPRLAPLIHQEITIRLLTGPHGPHLRHLVIAGSPGQQIAKVVAWLKQNFAQPLQGDDLADRAHMSPSTFRQHFRALTGVSPLQYQKQLRLQEARQLMLNENLDAGGAAVSVGYEKRVAVQPRVQPPVRRAASARCHAHAALPGCPSRRPSSNDREIDSSWNGSEPPIDPHVDRVSVTPRDCEAGEGIWRVGLDQENRK